MNVDDIRLLKEQRRNFIGERVEFQFWGDVHETKRFIGGLYYSSFKKTISNPGWTQGIKYTLQIDYNSLKIHCYSNGNYKELILPYESIEKVIIGKNKVIQMINKDENIIIRLNEWDDKRIQDFSWYLTWMRKGINEGIIFNDEKEIQERNQSIKKKRIEKGKEYENEETIIGILFIIFVIGFIIAIIREFIIIWNNM